MIYHIIKGKCDTKCREDVTGNGCSSSIKKQTFPVGLEHRQDGAAVSQVLFSATLSNIAVFNKDPTPENDFNAASQGK